MASGAPLSIPAADRHLRKVIYGFWAACCSIFLGALALVTVGRLPPGLALFFAGFFILLGIAFFLIGLVELVRRSMGVNVHVEDQGMALYPSLGARRARLAMATPGIGCAPIAIFIEYALGDSTVGFIMTAIVGCIISGLFFLTFVGSPYRRDAIHQGPLMRVSPDYFEIHPLTDKEPTRIPWDLHPSITGGHEDTTANGACLFVHVSLDGLEEDLVFDMTGTPISFSQLERLIDYFVDKPEERAKLGQPEGARLVRSLLTAP
ncbi:hypothetical protein [Sanguibacter keddieii]|uniref:hypothetical protein n=1 Tax=Sanguibacter keddieii TaxID=60920 RepID=UPI0006602402|nr:hypothetical protein [Sanguibacter keddieii]